MTGTTEADWRDAKVAAGVTPGATVATKDWFSGEALLVGAGVAVSMASTGVLVGGIGVSVGGIGVAVFTRGMGLGRPETGVAGATSGVGVAAVTAGLTAGMAGFKPQPDRSKALTTNRTKIE
jgi:hypothetical protein